MSDVQPPRKAVVSKISIETVRYREKQALEKRRAAISNGTESQANAEAKGRSLAAIANDAICRENLLRKELAGFDPNATTQYGSAMHRFNLLQSTAGLVNLSILREDGCLPEQHLKCVSFYDDLSEGKAEHKAIDAYRNRLQDRAIAGNAVSKRDVFQALQVHLQHLSKQPINPQAQERIKTLCENIDLLRAEFLSETAIRSLTYVDAWNEGQIPMNEVGEDFKVSNEERKTTGIQNRLILIANPYTCSAVETERQEALKILMNSILKTTWTLCHSIEAAHRGPELINTVHSAVNKVKGNIMLILQKSDQLLLAEKVG